MFSTTTAQPWGCRAVCYPKSTAIFPTAPGTFVVLLLTRKKLSIISRETTFCKESKRIQEVSICTDKNTLDTYHEGKVLAVPSDDTMPMSGYCEIHLPKICAYLTYL